jgi:Protein of unknown function (DUF1153)
MTRRSRLFFKLPPHERLLAPVEQWNYKRKADIVVGLRAKIITVEEVKQAHGISGDELARWQAEFDRGGAQALRSTSPGLRRAMAA